MSEKASSNDVIDNLRNAGLSPENVYAYAFGLCWGWLSETDREAIIKVTLKMNNPKGDN